MAEGHFKEGLFIEIAMNSERDGLGNLIIAEF
jgi:hypothetical protein